MNKKEHIDKFIKFSPFLSACKINIEDIELENFTKQNSIWDNRNPEKYVVLVCKGTVEVYAKNKEGHEVLINAIGIGQCFGIGNMYSEIPINTFLRNKRDCTLLFIEKEKVKKAVEKNKNAEIEYKKLCNRKINFLIERITLLSSCSARTKIMDFLYSQNEKQIKINKTKLARLLAMSRATLFREISQLEEEKIINYEGQYLSILDSKKIEESLHQED